MNSLARFVLKVVALEGLEAALQSETAARLQVLKHLPELGLELHIDELILGHHVECLHM
jgi:hypothetical protein